MRKYDLVIFLGSQITTKEGNIYDLPEHTLMKVQAAIIAWEKELVEKFAISGGYNIGVRYDHTKILEEANFSFEAVAKARNKKSEAEVIRNFMTKHGVPLEVIFLEELSATTEEQADIFKIILRRTTFAQDKKIAILTLLHHMNKALPIFRKTNPSIEPLFAEDLLALKEEYIKQVCWYYSVPRGGKQWPVHEIRKLLQEGRSVEELLKNS